MSHQTNDNLKEAKESGMSHKLIEKRRRDRINHCLADLSRMVPVAFARQNCGKLEKAEILEMTVEYLNSVQRTEIGIRYEQGEWYSSDIWMDFLRYFQAGFTECVKEAMKFMAEVEGLAPNDPRTIRLSTYLQSRFGPDFATALSIGPSLSNHVTTCNQSRATTAPVAPPPASQPAPFCQTSRKRTVGSQHRFCPYSSGRP